MQSVTPDVADAIGLTITRGSIVAALDAGGPADKAGVQEGDVIMSIGARTPRDSRDMWRTIARQEIGAPVELTIWRDGRIVTLSPVVAELDPGKEAEHQPDAAERAMAADYHPGFKMASVTAPLRTKFQLAANTRGVVVTEVEAASPAAERGIQAGDVVLRAGLERATSPEEIQSRIAVARARKEQYFLLLLKGPSGQRYVTLPLYPASAIPPPDP